MKCVPRGERASKKNTSNIDFISFVGGDRAAFDSWLGEMEEWQSPLYNVDDVSVEPGEPPAGPVPGAEKLTKGDLAAYLVSQSPGGLTQDEILKGAAEMSGRPYVPTSNREYFAKSTGFYGGPTWITSGLLKAQGKRGRQNLYVLGPKGAAAARKAAAALGR